VKQSYLKAALICGVWTAVLLLCAECNNTPPSNNASAQNAQPNQQDLQEGRLLASQYCQSCHKLPDPALLPRQVWNKSVLPAMGLFLGLKPANLPPQGTDGDNSLSYLPKHPLIDSIRWQKIVNYYVASAPEQLPAQIATAAIIKDIPLFEVQLPGNSFYNTVSIASYVKIDRSVQPARLLIGDGMAKNFYILNNQLQTLHSYTLNGPLVDLYTLSAGKYLACTIGDALFANNLKQGNIASIQIGTDGTLKADDGIRFDTLARPVAVNQADLNDDGKPDYIISQYGNLEGSLSWMENKGNNKYVPHILRNRPGTLKIVVQDYNHDGLPDIWAQFAQGDEGIFLYTNKGKGNFEEKRVLQFPPSYGSTSFQVIDFNRDGAMDILYTCGDNADYSQVLKPYHGVYLFLNDGNNNFKQKFFHPINGCYKAIALDFDGDNDLDIATISNFPAAVTPWESFVYLENKGNYDFQPYTLPNNTPFQKGVTMDAGDLDGDGKQDLVLGNGFYTSKQDGYKEPLFIVLKNKGTTFKKK